MENPQSSIMKPKKSFLFVINSATKSNLSTSVEKIVGSDLFDVIAWTLIVLLSFCSSIYLRSIL